MTTDLISTADREWLERIQDQFADGEGYDAPKDVMRRLAELGCVRRTSRDRYAITSFGMHVLFPTDWPLPLRTHDERMAELSA